MIMIRRQPATAPLSIPVPRPGRQNHTATSAEVSHRAGSRLLVVAITVAALAAACGSDSDEVIAEPGDLGHIHDFALAEDGTLLAAAHTGLFRVEDLDRAVLVGSERHDLMAMTRDQNGDLIASGHPDLRLPKYRIEGKQPHLGLIESPDLGHSWETTAMLGDADFHALATTSDGLYAAEATGNATWFRTRDGDWQRRGDAAITDLAVDPTDPEHVIGADLDGRLWMSTDRARNWRVHEGGQGMVEIEWPTGSDPYGIDPAGQIWTTSDPTGPWQTVASGPAEPETLWIDESGMWWLSVHGGDIWRSDNGASDWTKIYQSLP